MSRFKLCQTAFLFYFLACAVCACVSSAVKNPSRENKAFNFSSADFLGVNFKPGHPVENESFLNSLDRDDGFSLKNDLALLRKSGSIQLRVVGFTDDRECSGEVCLELSERRAKYLNDWYLSHGIPAAKFKKPKGLGYAMPVGDNSTPQGRLQNRRAYVSLVD